jgi:hypothetical protein
MGASDGRVRSVLPSLWVRSKPVCDRAHQPLWVLEDRVVAPVVGDVQLDHRRCVREPLPCLLSRCPAFQRLAAGDQERRDLDALPESVNTLIENRQQEVGHLVRSRPLANLAFDLGEYVTNVGLQGRVGTLPTIAASCRIAVSQSGNRSPLVSSHVLSAARPSVVGMPSSANSLASRKPPSINTAVLRRTRGCPAIRAAT